MSSDRVVVVEEDAKRYAETTFNLQDNDHAT